MARRDILSHKTFSSAVVKFTKERMSTASCYLMLRNILLIAIIVFCFQSAGSASAAYWQQSYNSWEGLGTNPHYYCVSRTIMYIYDTCGFISKSDNTSKSLSWGSNPCQFWGVGYWYNPNEYYYPKPAWYSGNGGLGPDSDADGYFVPNPNCKSPHDDCNDNDPTIYQGCECSDGTTRECPYSGTPETLNIGLCKAGIQTCTHSKWGACTGEILPTTEVCDDKDNNCNGATDEGCALKQQNYLGVVDSAGMSCQIQENLYSDEEIK